MSTGVLEKLSFSQKTRKPFYTVVLAPGIQVLLCLGPQHHILMARTSLEVV